MREREELTMTLRFFRMDVWVAGRIINEAGETGHGGLRPSLRSLWDGQVEGVVCI